MRRLCVIAAMLLLASGVVSEAWSWTTKRRVTPGQRAAIIKARSLFNRNLIANGDAELEEDGYASGWFPRETAESQSYGRVSGEWSTRTNSGLGARERYFRLPVPQGEEAITVEQWILVSAESILIDRGFVAFDLSGRMGSLVGDPGTAVLSARFENAIGRVLSEAATEPVLGADLSRPDDGFAVLVERRVSGRIPLGTRRVHVTLAGRSLRYAECPNCIALGLADQLALVLTRATLRKD